MTNHTYDFIKTTRDLTEADVKSIVHEAGFDPASPAYQEHKNSKPPYWSLTTSTAMAISPLQKAAKDLKIPVTITG